MSDIPTCLVPPEPAVVSNERRVELIYLCGLDYELDRPLTRVFQGADDLVAVVRFSSYGRFSFGGPNDHGLPKHPLYTAGLTYYQCQEYPGNVWARYLNSTYRHFLFPFQDSTFECIADEYSVFVYRGTVDEVVAERARTLNE